MAKAKAKRRGWTEHRGVTLVRRGYASGSVTWRARWKDPRSGRWVFVGLDALDIMTPEGRAAWARRKAQELRVERAAVAEGRPLAAPIALDAAIDAYLASAATHLRASTVREYGSTLHLFQRWAREQRLSRLDRIDGPALARFRIHALATPKRRSAKSGPRGGKAEASSGAAPRTIAKHFRQLQSFLRRQIELGQAPRLTRDMIAGSLRAPQASRELPTFFSGAEARRLLEAALRHDGEAFARTRLEHAGAAAPGSTPKYPAIAPLVLLAILTGARIGELLALAWADVDLDSTDDRGAAVGIFRVKASNAKTRRERIVDLAVAPSARALLQALRLQRGGEKTAVFGLTRHEADGAMERLRTRFGAPERASWHECRRTTATVLTNAPGIYGGASAYRSARQLGHSVAVAERHYLGLLSISRDARSVEAALGIEELAAEIVRRAAGGQRGAPPTVAAQPRAKKA